VGDLEGAIRHHERAIELRPNDPRLRRLLDAERAALRGRNEAKADSPDPLEASAR
jgi:Flp pilus assembly protein TadD